MDAPRSLLILAVVALLAAQPARADEKRFLDVGFGQPGAWKVSAEKPWWGLVDLRDMLNLFHPFALSKTGAFAGASRECLIPAGWQPPFALRFFCADDYFADAEKHKPGQLGTESFFEHRFKQVLIDDTVVWSRDVADENTHGSQTIFQVDLTPHVTPGKPFKLTFRAFDKVSTEQRGERDVWFIAGTWYAAGDGKTEQPPRFHTAVWFADPVLGEQKAVEAAPPGSRPHEAIVAARHKARWPMPPPGDRMKSPAPLALVTPATAPAPGFPLTCGIPLPPGALRDVNAVRLCDRAGKELPVQARRTGIWPDGSARWLLLTTITPAGAAAGDRFQLHLGKDGSVKPRAALKLRREGRRLSIDTGAVRLELGSDPQTLIDAVCLAGKEKPVLAGLRPRIAIRVNGATVPVTASWQDLEIRDQGPLAVCVELPGSLDTPAQHIGRFVFRLTAYAGLATVQTQFRVLNHVKPEPYKGTAEDAPLEVTDLALVAALPGGVDGTALGMADGRSIEAGEGIRLLQDTPEHFRAGAAEGKQAQGWIAAGGSGGCVQASVWRFWQQYPKSLAADAKGLEIGLFAPTEAIRAYRPRFGEAKRHDVWLTFSDKPLAPEARKALGLLADQPPRLFDGEWFCRSGGVNVLDPDWFRGQPKLKAYVEGQYGDVSTASVTGKFGVRDFGDMPYKDDQWLNGYWAMVQGALNWGLAAGDQRWIERSFEIARHIADVDCVHLPADHPDYEAWGGVTCALGSDHSAHGGLALWPAFQIGESLLLHYWMTGDPDSLEAGLANADHILRSKAGWGSTEARQQARAMLTLLRAWEVTGDPKYREGAERYLDLKYQTEHVVDWRRGAYIQPTYQNWRCISAGLNSMYAGNIYEFYRLTGDVGAAQMVVAIADSVYAESMLPQEEGLGSFLFYVRYSRSAWYYTQMAILFHAAYDLTGDLRFLRAGRAAFARYLLCVDGNGKPWYQPFHNFGWLDPELGGWMLRFRDVPTEPFTITTQTPEPDPAAYCP